MKNFFRLLVLLTLFAASTGEGAAITEDTVVLGKAGSTSNKSVQFGAGRTTPKPQIRYNVSGGTLEFSHNGTDFSDIGSGAGGGGGLNLLKNADFESGLSSGWTNTGGTFLRVTSGGNLLFGKGSATFAASGSGQYFQSDLITVPIGLGLNNCAAKVSYKGNSTGLTMKILDSTGVLVASQPMDINAANGAQRAMNFPCPAAGTQIRLRVESTAATSTVAFDRMSLGEPDNLIQTSQARFYGSAKWGPVASCVWGISQTYFMDDFPANGNCGFPTVTGAVNAPATQVPRITLNNLEPGTYVVTAVFTGYNTDSNLRTFRLADDSGQEGVIQARSGSNSFVDNFTLVGTFNYSSFQASRQIKLQGHSASGTVSIGADGSNGQTLEMQVVFLPSGNAAGYLPTGPVQWHIDANLGGGSNVPLSTSSVASYIGVEGSDKDMVLNPGSMAAKIPCAGTEPATGLTCANGADEQVGVSFDLPAAGKVEACFDFNQVINSSSGGNTTWQIIETPNNAQSSLLLGNNRVNNQVGAYSIGFPTHVCGEFEFATAGPKTLRLMYTQLVGGYSQNVLVMDRSPGNLGGRDIHVSVRPITQNVPAPVLVGNHFVSPSGAAESVVRFAFDDNAGGACTGSCYTSLANVGAGLGVTRIGVGLYTFVFPSGIFSSPPVCTCNGTQGGGTNGVAACFAVGQSPTGGTVLAKNGSGVDILGNVICVGPK